MNETIYILGNGKMAKAIAKGLENKNIKFCYILREKKENIKNYILYDDFNIDEKICILCFKPHNLKEVSKRFAKQNAKIIISPLAGVSLNELGQIKSNFYAKIMPNIAAEFNKSCTTYIFSDDSHEYAKKALKIIQSLGTATKCESEKELNLAMAINGCAPAFLAIIAEAIANAGLSIGLKNEKSYELTKALFSSFESLINHSHPAIIKENVCSPAGVSIKGVEVLEDYKVRSALISAIKKSAGC